MWRIWSEAEELAIQRNLERALERIEFQGLLDRSGIQEKLRLLEDRKAKLEQKIKVAADEIEAQEETRRRLSEVQDRLDDLGRKHAALASEQRELRKLAEEGGLLVLWLRKGKAERKARRAEVAAELSQLEAQIRQGELEKLTIERSSASEWIRQQRNIIDLQGQHTSADEVSAIQKEADSIVQMLKDMPEDKKEDAETERGLIATRTEEKKANLTLSQEKNIGAQQKQGKTRSEAENEARKEALPAQILLAPEGLEKQTLLVEQANREGVPGTTKAEPDQNAKEVITPQKPAAWDSKLPSEPWCPEQIKPHLNYLANFTYQDNLQTNLTVLQGWKGIVAMRRGKMHAHRGTHREDAYGIAIGPHFTVACVSDGAGSYQYSRIGSETTCREVTHKIREGLQNGDSKLAALEGNELATALVAIVYESIIAACDMLRRLAADSGSQPKDFRCTLLLTLLYRNDKSELAVICQVGDGFIAGLKKTGTATRYGASDSGEFSGEVNCFVPDEATPVKAKQSFLAHNASELETLILCSDGIEDPFYPIDKKAAAIFRQLYSGVDVETKLEGFVEQPTHGPIIGVPNAEELLAQWLSFEKKGENDDRTILVLHRDPVSLDPATIVPA